MFCFYDKLRDTVTGYEGVVTCIIDDLGSVRRYALQAPVNKEGKVPDPVSFDEPQLEMVEESEKRRSFTTTPAFNFKDEVEETLTGIKGVITSCTEFLNGCVRYGVQTKFREGSDKLPILYYAYEQSLVLVKASTAKEVKKTGGPIGGVPAMVKDQF